MLPDAHLPKYLLQVSQEWFPWKRADLSLTVSLVRLLSWIHSTKTEVDQRDGDANGTETLMGQRR